MQRPKGPIMARLAAKEHRMNIGQRIAEQSKPFFSYEFFPPQDPGEWPAFFGVVERLLPAGPLFASVTCGAGGSAQDGTLEIVSRLKKDFSLETMAHLTCVGATPEHVTDFLARLHDNGVDNVLALRGDPPKDGAIDQEASPFRHASDLVRFVRQKFPDFGIGVAGYPAPHPESPSFSSDWRYTVAKIREGANFVVTQLFFDVREYFHFVDRLNDMGVSVPVIPGILPVQSLASIRRTLSLCGANIPGKLYLELEAAHAEGGTEAVRQAGIAYAVRQIRTLLEGGAPGIHLYTLNRAETCLNILNEVGVL